MQPQSIMEEQESRRELYDALKRLSQREQTYLLYRYGFTDGEEHPLIGTAIYFHLTKGRAKKTEKQAMDNLWLELKKDNPVNIVPGTMTFIGDAYNTS